MDSWGRRGLAAVGGVVLALVAAGCWAGYGFDDNNSRSNPLETTVSAANASTLAEVWRVDGVDGVTSTPAVVGDWVYFGSWDGYLRAVDLDDGTERWATRLTSGQGPGVMVDASPRIHGNTVYVGDGEGVLHAVDRRDGTIRWSVPLDTHPQTRLFGSPVVVDGLVVIGVASYELAIPKADYTFTGSVVALDAETGDEVWRLATTTDDATAGAGVSVWSTAAIDRARHMLFIGTGNTYEEPAAPLSDSLLAIDYETGELVWSRQFTEGDVYTIFGTPPQGPDADIGAAPNLFTIDGRAVVGVGDKAGVYAVLDRDTGETVWARELTEGSHLGGVMLTSAVAGGVVYVTSNVMVDAFDYTNPANSSVTFALDATDGSVLWQRTIPASSFGALTHANGVLFQPTTPGVLYALDATDGAVLWTDDLGADLGGGVSVSSGTVLAPYGFWFFGAPPTPAGGLVAYRPAEPPLPEEPRGLVAMRDADGVRLGWRLHDHDTDDVGFNVYRTDAGGPPERVSVEPHTATTDWWFPGDDGIGAEYHVRVVRDGVEVAESERVTVANEGTEPYVSIPLDGDDDVHKLGVGDLDGDGRFDVVVKRPDVNVDPFNNWRPSDDTYELEAYDADGDFLWRYDLGWSIETGTWYSPFLVHDFDGDGRAEVVAKTSDGDHRDEGGMVTQGPEHLVVLDGATGGERHRVPWPAQRTENYNWYSRNQLGVAHLDGQHPSLIVARGTYCYLQAIAFDIGPTGPVERWAWNSHLESPQRDGPDATTGANTSDCARQLVLPAFRFDPWWGQGAHSMHTADVDGDGNHEVVLGAAVLDDDGTGLWSTGMGHTDHAWVGDHQPDRPGLEIYYGHEPPRSEGGVMMVDAADGTLLWQLAQATEHVHNEGMCADIDAREPGAECYSGEKSRPDRWLHAADGRLLADETTLDLGLTPRVVHWDADLQRELAHGGRIYSYDTGEDHLVGLVGDQLAWVDVLGDWREEVIVALPGELRIYTTTVPATDRRPTFMDDLKYRADVAHTAMGYRQAPTPGYALTSP